MSSKNFSEILPPNVWRPGPGKVGQGGLKVLHLRRHSQKTRTPQAKKFFFFQKYSPNWTEVDIGVDNFKKGLEKIVKHEQSVMHFNATSYCFMTTKYRITKDETVISQLTSEEKRE